MDEIWSLSNSDFSDIINTISYSDNNNDCIMNNNINDPLFSGFDTAISAAELFSSPSNSESNDDNSIFSSSDLSSSPQSSPDLSCGSFSPDNSPSFGYVTSCVKQEKIIDIKPSSNINKTKTTRTRKRKTTSSSAFNIDKKFTPCMFDGNASLIFSRAELLKMSVAELDARILAVEKTRSLSTEEKKAIKKQRRMIKNRESAYASRVRKKQMLENMEEAMKKIEQENLELKQKVYELEKENNLLKSRLNTNSSSCSSSSFWSIGNDATSKLVSQTSTSLFIIILSFGLLFAQIQPSDYSSPFLFSSQTPFSSISNDKLGSGHVISENSFIPSIKSHHILSPTFISKSPFNNRVILQDSKSINNNFNNNNKDLCFNNDNNYFNINSTLNSDNDNIYSIDNNLQSPSSSQYNNECYSTCTNNIVNNIENYKEPLYN